MRIRHRIHPIQSSTRTALWFGLERIRLGTSVTGLPAANEIIEMISLLETFRFKEAMFPEQAAADREAIREAIEARRQRRRSLSQTSPAPVPKLGITQQLCYGRYPVPAGRYLAFPFRVTATATVRGTFEASGGAQNDIEVVIGPRSEVLNWLNGHRGAITYQSERLTSGTLEVAITDPGDYRLVFSNTFSVVSGKTLGVSVQLVSGAEQ